MHYAVGPGLDVKRIINLCTFPATSQISMIIWALNQSETTTWPVLLKTYRSVDTISENKLSLGEKQRLIFPCRGHCWRTAVFIDRTWRRQWRPRTIYHQGQSEQRQSEMFWLFFLSRSGEETNWKTIYFMSAHVSKICGTSNKFRLKEKKLKFIGFLFIIILFEF